MTTLGKVIVFLLGICLSVQVVAAFFRVLDLWYMIRLAYPKVLRGILGWVGISCVIAVVIKEPWRGAFLWGLILYVPFYLVNFFLIQRAIRYWSQPKEIE